MPLEQFEIHCEPGPLSSFRLFLMQDGNRVSSASSLVPKPLRELLQSQKNSVALEQDLIDYLNQTVPPPPIHLHTRDGVFRTQWDGSSPTASRTELDLLGGRVRVEKILVHKNEPADQVRRFVRIGERLIGDLPGERLLLLTDVSGWYMARGLETVTQQAPAVRDGMLAYEPETELQDPGLDGDDFGSVMKKPTALKSSGEGYALSEPVEISTALLNDRKITYPLDQKQSYLKDLHLKVQGQAVEAAEGEMDVRLTFVRVAGSATMRLKASVLWNGQWFDFAEAFFKHFEHLHHLRAGAVKKKAQKKFLAEAAMRLLFEADAGSVDRLIELEIAKMDISDEDARWEASEYLKRFHQSFVQQPTGHLLASEKGWFVAAVPIQKVGRLFLEVQRHFGGDYLIWLQSQSKEVPLDEFFSALRSLHAALTSAGVQVYYHNRAVQKSRLKTRVVSQQDERMNWFEIHPEISWQGRPLSDSEWRSILENQGIWQSEDLMEILDDQSIRLLEMMRHLLHRRGRTAESEQALRIPKLHILDWVHLRSMGAEVTLSPEAEKLVSRLLRFEKMDTKETPGRFRGQLRDYQKDGYDWLAFLYEHSLGGCLADDMGLGKTVQAIVFLGGIREGKIRQNGGIPRVPHLIVLPSTLVFNWRQELLNFYPDFKVAEYGEEGRSCFKDADIVLVTYDLLRREEKVFQKQKFHVVIFDEAQYIKNIMAKRTLSARRLDSRFTLTLTGTPLENHLGEYFSILDLSLPGLLGRYEDLRREGYTDPADRLKRRAAPFVLRRTKEKTLKELPPKSENEVFLRMTPKQKALYQKVVSRVKKDVEQAFAQNAAPQASMSALTAILRLRQVCVSPELVDKKVQDSSPKIDYLLSKLHELADEDHSALVFSQFTSFLDVLEAKMKMEHLAYFRMDGSTPKARRKEMVEAFQYGTGAPVFLISLKTGGVGLNLTRASYVFHLDPWWNPAVEDQASDRVHRIGQKKNVFVTRLLMKHSIEEKMMILKQKKSRLYRDVLDGALPKSGKPGLLSREDFEFLLDS